MAEKGRRKRKREPRRKRWGVEEEKASRRVQGGGVTREDRTCQEPSQMPSSKRGIPGQRETSLDPRRLNRKPRTGEWSPGLQPRPRVFAFP